MRFRTRQVWGDGQSALFLGTLLVRGHGLARVTATGARSEIGRIGTALQTLKPEPSPLKKQTARLVNVLALLALAASFFLVLAYGLLRGDWLAALPQEFAVVLTVISALGAWRLFRQNVLTRRIAAIETLGATSVLCVDKTGTLTENRMTVAHLYVESSADQNAEQPCVGMHLAIDDKDGGELSEVFHSLVEFSILASVADSFDPMEKAFHRLGKHFLKDTEHLHRHWTLLQAYGLTPELRAMSHVWRADAMTRPPRDAQAPLFAGMTLVLALLQGLGVLGVVLGAYVWGGLRLTEDQTRAFAFATLVAGSVVPV